MAQSFERIRYEVDGAVATVTMDRPDQANAQDSAMIRHMAETGELVQAGMLNSIGTVNLPLFDYVMLPPFVLSPDPRVATAKMTTTSSGPGVSVKLTVTVS